MLQLYMWDYYRMAHSLLKDKRFRSWLEDKKNLESGFFLTLGKLSAIRKYRKEYLLYLKKNNLDTIGYYTGYCQCSCDRCKKDVKHCQGLVCRGD